jgi:hypothetical protein
MPVAVVVAFLAVGGVLLGAGQASGATGMKITVLRDQLAGLGAPYGENDLVTPSPADVTAEPSIAVNPGDPGNAVLAYKDGYGEAIGVAVTHDAGGTWNSGPLRCTDRPRPCPEMAIFGTTDPVVAFGPGDVVHVAYITPAADQILVSTSTDGGTSWGVPQVAVAATSDGVHHHDKEWMVVDTATGAGHHPGRIYLVWAQEPLGSPQATFSDDGGKTWQAPSDFPAGHGSDFQALVLATGSLGVFYDTGDLDAAAMQWGAPSAPEQYLFLRAPAPATASAPLLFDVPIPVGPADHRNEADQTTVFDGSSAAVDPSSGQMYSVWTRSRPASAFNDIVLSSSSDGGASWSTPRVVGTDPSGDLFHPAVAVGRDGVVHGAWRDRPAVAGELGNLVDTWTTASTDHAQSFATPVRLTAVRTDVTYAQRPLYPAQDAWFVGDYDQIATSGPLTYLARAEAYQVGPDTQYCPQDQGTLAPEGCITAPHERVWVAVLRQG